MFQPLTQEQYQKAKDAGFSSEKIIEMEKRRKAESDIPEQPIDKTLGNIGNAIGGFLGGNKIGQYIGEELGSRFSPEAQRLKQLAPDLYEKQVGSSVTPGQLVGDIAQTGLTVGTLGGGGLAGGLGKQVLKSAAIGAGFGAAGGLKEKAELPELAKRTAIGGVVGGALPLAGAGLKKLGELATGKGARKLADVSLRVSPKETARKPGEALLKRGLGGKSSATIQEATEAEANQVDDSIQNILRGSKEKFKVKDALTQVVQGAKKQGATITEEELKERIARAIPSHAGLLSKKYLTAQEANQLRMAIDKNIRAETAFGPFARALSNEQKQVRAFDNTLRNLVQTKTGTQELFRQQAEAINLSNLAEKAGAKIQAQGRPGFLDIASVGVGSMAGGIPGAITGVAIERALRNPQVQSGLAQVLRNSQALAPILSKLAPAERFALLQLFNQAQKAD